MSVWLLAVTAFRAKGTGSWLRPLSRWGEVYDDASGEPLTRETRSDGLRYSKPVATGAVVLGFGLAVALFVRASSGTEASTASLPRVSEPTDRVTTVPLSQPGTVSQEIAGVRLRVVYARPVARGRELFGGIVPFGELWNPGADQATRIELSGDLLVQGARLPAGKYSLWAIPEPDRWTLIFSRAWDVYHTPYPKGQDALRITVVPERAPHMETLAFYLPVVDKRRAVLSLHWGQTRLDIPLEVP